MENLMDKIVSLCKRRGFIFQGSEIYGGLANTWDYGPYGAELKNNVKKLWWKMFVQDREDMVGVDASILMNPRVWEASGHITSFSDPLVDCKECNQRFRADKLLEEKTNKEYFLLEKEFIEKQDQAFNNQDVTKKLFDLSDPTKSTDNEQRMASDFINRRYKTDPLHRAFLMLGFYKIKCPNCQKINWTEVRSFNLMFKTYQGVIEEQASLVYLRPETAQGIFVNFKNIQQSTRKRLPFGIGQIGKAFRNEITPGNFIFRTREFEQMEIEYFVKENEWKPIYDEWRKTMEHFFTRDLGFKKDRMRWRQHEKEELSHYSKETWDVEYQFPFGWGELWGIAYRTDYDLKQHEKFSGEKMDYLDPETNEKFTPHCIEPTFGADRTVLVALLEAYDEDEAPSEKPGKEKEVRVVMRFPYLLAPIKVAVLPLMKKEELAKKAREIFGALKKEWTTEYDDGGSIGKRYRRHDEIGTPFCVTVDFDTLKDQAVTVRDRDTMKQQRVGIKKLSDFLRQALTDSPEP